ncbi:MAG: hypothetical protein ACP5TY_06045, partial [Thermodesulforhabdaceae bacterium]
SPLRWLFPVIASEAKQSHNCFFVRLPRPLRGLAMTDAVQIATPAFGGLAMTDSVEIATHPSGARNDTRIRYCERGNEAI